MELVPTGAQDVSAAPPWELPPLEAYEEMQSPTRNTLAVALSLAEEWGIPAFPCHASKQPATKNGFKDASKNLGQLEDWFSGSNGALIGVPTGRTSGLLVIDVDPDGEGWYRENADKLECGRIHKTRRGWHLIYRMPDAEIRNSAGKVARGVDVRAEGGYIIWWPAEGLETVGSVDDIKPPPAWIIDVLVKPAPSKPAQSSADAIIEGGRNDALARLAGKLRRDGLSEPAMSAALMAVNAERCRPPLQDTEVRAIAASVGRYDPARPDAPADTAPKIELRPLHEIVAEKREAAWLDHNILEREVLAVLAGQRGTFKSFVALHWAMSAALSGEQVVILSGEGAGLDRRADAWMRVHGNGLDIKHLAICALERPLNLNLAVEMEGLRTAVEALPRPPALIVIDTLSKFSAGLKENDNGEVAAYLATLSQHLRDAFKSTVLLVVHSGHGETGRPRGASALMANPDAEYIVTRPNPVAMTVTVTRERFKDCPSLPPLAYEAKVIDLGRSDAYGDPVTSLALHSTDAAPQKPKLGGKNQERAATALKEWCRVNPEAGHIGSDAIAGILRTQGIDRRRRAEVLNYLVNARVLTPSVAGFTIDKGML